MQKPVAVRFVFGCTAILLMGAIFFFSGQTGAQSSAASGTVVKAVVQAVNWLGGAVRVQQGTPAYDALQHFVRKGAHFTVYLLLGVSWMGFFATFPWRLRRAALCSFLVCAAYAASDEWHQSFVSARSAQVGDVLLDAAGAAAGVLLLWAGCKVLQRVRKQRKIRKQ